jgi:hypothetical protein
MLNFFEIRSVVSARAYELKYSRKVLILSSFYVHFCKELTKKYSSAHDWVEVVGKTVLKWISGKQDVRVWIGSWLDLIGSRQDTTVDALEQGNELLGYSLIDRLQANPNLRT